MRRQTEGVSSLPAHFLGFHCRKFGTCLSVPLISRLAQATLSRQYPNWKQQQEVAQRPGVQDSR